MGTINSEYTQLINQFKSEVEVIVANAIFKIENSVHGLQISQTTSLNPINDFESNINSMLLNSQNQLEEAQNEFYASVDSLSSSVSSQVEDAKLSIEQKKQEALLQLNKSENSAVTRLEETYDIGVATILSAEKTALYNLGIFKDQLIEELKKTADSVDSTIKDKINLALKELEQFSEILKEEIKGTEIQIKEDIKAEAKKLIEEAYLELDRIKIEMQNFAALLKREITEHKEKVINEIRQDKEKFFIEMEREQNRLLEVLRLREYEISVNLNKKEQAIISNIAMVVAGYDRELEVIKQSKINEFIDALELISKEAMEDSINNAKVEFNKQVEIIIQEIKEGALAETLEKIRQLMDNFYEQRYETVLKAGETIIQLPRTEYTITNRLKLYLDGMLQVREKHYKVDIANRSIILTRSYPDDIDVIVTEDMFNENIESQLNDALEVIQEKKQESVTEMTNYKDSCINEIVTKKEESIKEMEEKVPDLIKDMNIALDNFVDESKSELKNYIENFREGTYAIEVGPMQKNIMVPPRELIVNRSVKVYFDGILQTFQKHYDLDFLTNSVIILQPFSYSIDLMLLQNIPVTNLPKREATDQEIDGLFEHYYRLGVNNDIDNLYDENMVNDHIDNFFKK